MYKCVFTMYWNKVFWYHCWYQFSSIDNQVRPSPISSQTTQEGLVNLIVHRWRGADSVSAMDLSGGKLLCHITLHYALFIIELESHQQIFMLSLKIWNFQHNHSQLTMKTLIETPTYQLLMTHTHARHHHLTNQLMCILT